MDLTNISKEDFFKIVREEDATILGEKLNAENMSSDEEKAVGEEVLIYMNDPQSFYSILKGKDYANITGDDVIRLSFYFRFSYLVQ